MKIKYFLRCLKNFKLMGISTGFFLNIICIFGKPKFTIGHFWYRMSEDETKYDGKSTGFLKELELINI